MLLIFFHVHGVNVPFGQITSSCARVNWSITSWGNKNMNTSDKTKKTKKQLRWNAIITFLFVLLASTYPLTLINDYRLLGYIYTGKLRSGPDVVTATGNDALVIIYGVSATMAIVWIVTVYYVATCFKKIKRGEFSIEDESPEFVICSRCKTPQYSKELVDGHCAKCRGDVENLEGYHDRHRDEKTGQ